MSGRLSDKTVLVTNLPAEVLAAAARRCLAEGARVVVASGEPLADALARDQVRVVEHGGSDPAAWQQLGELVVSDFGGLDILVQGLTAHHPASVAETSLAQFRAANAQNLEATFLATQAAFRAMATNGGAIVNVSSAWGVVGAANAASLCAGAGGLKLMTKAAGVEGVMGAVKIRVNCILAGAVEGLLVPADVRRPPIKGSADMTSLLDAIVFLASDDSTYMTGAMLPLDGGLTAS
jgi:meso-butanediol dehydrogenase/(S,S)-butanediol dehydrogenase/diacetyl reductase